MNAHTTIDADIFELAAEEIAAVDIAPETELERRARLERSIIAVQEARAAEALQRGRDDAAVIKDQRRQLRAQFSADLAELKAQEVQAKADTLATIAVAERLAAASRAALAEIERG